MHPRESLLILIGILLLGMIYSGNSVAQDQVSATVQSAPLKKIKDVIIYQDTLYYSAFPSVVKRRNGEILVAFRRAPERRLFGEKGISHTDPNSYLVLIKSSDGEHWSKEPGLIYAHPFGGSQDPCLLQLRDGTLLCSSYLWSVIRPKADSILDKKLTVIRSGRVAMPNFAFLGGYLVRSADGGKSWSSPIYPPHVPSDAQENVWGDPLPAYNRGAMCEGRDGRIYWVVATGDGTTPAKTSNHLLVSDDKGLTWSYKALVATDKKVSFDETSILETPGGDLVAFMRTANMPGRYSCIARSKDGGKSFAWQSLNFYGYPLHALKLPDNRVLLTYGYRNKPYGIRARILNAECTDFATAPEFTIREDGGSGDLGYSWSTMLDNKRALVVYYFNTNDGNRFIAGSLLELQ